MSDLVGNHIVGFPTRRLKCYIIIEPSHEKRKQHSGFPTRPDTNQPVQSQKQTRDLKFWIYVEEELICAFDFAYMYADCWFSNAE